MVDPGIGHESHQLAILVAPGENVNHGLVTYAASEPIQLVALHGPLGEGEDAGQPIWTTDDETKFALTLVDPETKLMLAQTLFHRLLSKSAVLHLLLLQVVRVMPQVGLAQLLHRLLIHGRLRNGTRLASISHSSGTWRECQSWISNLCSI